MYPWCHVATRCVGPSMVTAVAQWYSAHDLFRGPCQRVHERLLELEPTLDKIKQRRDQYIAHQDGTKRDPPNPLDVLEIDKATESLEEGFRALGAFLQRSDYVFESDLRRAQSETAMVMTILRKAWPRSAS